MLLSVIGVIGFGKMLCIPMVSAEISPEYHVELQVEVELKLAVSSWVHSGFN